METNYTPTPWKTKFDIECQWHEILGADGKHIAGVSSARSWEENKANAAHIVHCVTLHDELVAMLARHYSNHKPCGHDFDCVCLGDEARALLSRARGEGGE